MKFGILLSDAPAQSSAREWFSDNLVMTRAAAEAGFHSIVMGQHFVTHPHVYLQPIPMLARLAAEIPETMELVTGILISPLLPPVEFAEQLATLDVISNGRLTVGVGAGYREDEFRPFGIEVKDRTKRLVEHMTLVRKLWSGETVNHVGEYYNVTGVRCGIVPLQRPAPPIWMGGNADAAVKRAARHADAWYGYVRSDLSLMEKQLALYKLTLAEAGRPYPAELPMRREIFIAETNELAWAQAEAMMAPRMALNDQWGIGKDLPEESQNKGTFKDMARGRYIIGDPEACGDEIQRYRDALGELHIIIRIRWPDMSMDQTLRAFQLFGQVIQRFRAG